ncbi:MAG: hypothetical protein JSV68_00715 [Anaerolineaceae bacterium]|nr:MAG: hypothetical protein JSV68_00715 [Anaerolineaceae bacterium]
MEQNKQNLTMKERRAAELVAARVLLGAALAYVVSRFVIWPRWGGAGVDLLMVAGIIGLMLLVAFVLWRLARR